jgi:hypothetical protein
LILCRKGLPLRSVVFGLLWSHLGGLPQVNHDLAERVTGLHRSQCLWRLIEGVGLEHLGIDFACGDQGGEGGCSRRLTGDENTCRMTTQRG